MSGEDDDDKEDNDKEDDENDEDKDEEDEPGEERDVDPVTVRDHPRIDSAWLIPSRSTRGSMRPSPLADLKPWRRALVLDRALPSAVRGPRLLAPLARLVSPAMGALCVCGSRRSIVLR
jgi:hypothetical protein